MRYIESRLRKPSEPPSASPLLRRETFARTTLFASLTPIERQQIGALAGERRFETGEILFYEGDPADGLWVIGEGAVKIAKLSPAGREIMLTVIAAPESVAEIPLFDGGPYPATVTAIQPVTAFFLHKEDFRRFCESHPQVPLKVLAIAGRRLRQLVQLVEMITFGSVRQRLAQVLLQAAEEQGGDLVHVPLTHEEIAARLGTVREVVSRNLARFQAEGFLRVVKRRVEILNPGALRREAETEY